MKIDQNVPLPPAHVRNKYPWHDMSVGDSFSVPADSVETSSLRVMAYVTGRRLKRSYVMREQPDGTRRIWRTA